MTISAAPSQTNDKKAIIGLVIVCLAWGWSFPTLKWAMDSFQNIAPDGSDLARVSIIAGFRYIAASLIYFAIYKASREKYTRKEINGGILIGLTFIIGNILQMIGLKYTTPSISGFLTATVVLFLPLADFFILKRKLSNRLWLAVLFAILGTITLSLGGDSNPKHQPPFPYFGEILTIISALFFTGQIIYLDIYGQSTNTTRITFIFFLVSGIFCLIVAQFSPNIEKVQNLTVLINASKDFTLQWTMLSVIIICTLLAFHMMNTNQPKVNPSIAGVIYCLEPVFATIYSILLGIEGITLHLIIGGSFIFAGTLWITSEKKS